MPDMVNLEQYYTAKEAAEVLSRNSGKKIDAAYNRTLARYGKFHPKRCKNGSTRLLLPAGEYGMIGTLAATRKPVHTE